MTIPEALALRTKNLMKEKNITQKELECLSKIPHYQMNKILSCKYKDIDVKFLYKLSVGFNMSIKDFVNDELFNLPTFNNWLIEIVAKSIVSIVVDPSTMLGMTGIIFQITLHVISNLSRNLKPCSLEIIYAQN